MNTNDYRIAPSGEGPQAAQWKDKPHRLLYDLCQEIERLTGQPSPANGGWSKEWPTVPGRYWCYGYRAHTFQTFFFNVINMDDGRSISTPWIVDDAFLYAATPPANKIRMAGGQKPAASQAGGQPPATR